MGGQQEPSGAATASTCRPRTHPPRCRHPDGSGSGCEGKRFLPYDMTETNKTSRYMQPNHEFVDCFVLDSEFLKSSS